MAGNKKKARKPVKNHFARTAHQVSTVISKALSEFQIIGDMNHRPTVFKFSQIHMHLKGPALTAGLDHAYKFLCQDLKPWTMIVFYYFKVGDEIKVETLNATIPDTTMYGMGEMGEELLDSFKEAVYDLSDEYNDDTFKFYGYFITYGTDLNIDRLSEQLSRKFLETTDVLEDVVPDRVVKITPEYMLLALEHDKFFYKKVFKVEITEIEETVIEPEPKKEKKTMSKHHVTIPLYLAKETFKMQLAKGILALWESSEKEMTGHAVSKKNLQKFCTDLPFHNRRSESIDEFIQRHLLEEIRRRYSRNEYELTVKANNSYITEQDIKSAVWGICCNKFGGFANTESGIYGRPWNVDGEDVFIYRFHKQEDVVPAFDFNEVRVFVVDNHKVIVEYNKDVLSKEVMEKIIEEAALKKVM